MTSMVSNFPGLRQTLGALRSMSPHHRHILIIALVLQALDGFDLNTIAFAGSSIARALSLSPTQLGVLFASAQLGSLLGSASVGFGAGRVERKIMLVLAVIAMGFGSLLTVFAPTYEVLLGCRVVTGLGLGAVLPLTVGYAVEFFPGRVRGGLSALIVSALNFGTMIAGVVAAILIPRFGWHSIFWVGGVLPMLVLPFMLRLPSSLSDQLRKGATVEHVEALCAKYGVSFAELSDRGEPRSVDTKTAFPIEARYLLPLIAISASGLMGAMVAYFLSSWVPTLVQARGLSLQDAVLAGSFKGAGGIVGLLVCGVLMDRKSPYFVLGIAYITSMVVLAALMTVQPIPALIFALVFLAGACSVGTGQSKYAFINLMFPTRLRTPVLAWGAVLSRTAGLIAPAGAGFILSSGGTPSTLFMIASALALSSALTLLISGFVARRLAAI